MEKCRIVYIQILAIDNFFFPSIAPKCPARMLRLVLTHLGLNLFLQSQIHLVKSLFVSCPSLALQWSRLNSHFRLDNAFLKEEIHEVRILYQELNDERAFRSQYSNIFKYCSSVYHSLQCFAELVSKLYKEEEASTWPRDTRTRNACQKPLHVSASKTRSNTESLQISSDCRLSGTSNGWMRTAYITWPNETTKQHISTHISRHMTYLKTYLMSSVF